jgi:glycosyltransferase involved in cell wall biosynthesis
LPLCPAAIAVGKKFGKPVILDMAECYSEMLRATWQFENFRLQNIFARNPYLADLIERWSIRRVTQIWAMVEESRDRLMRLGVPPRNVRIVGNTPTPSRFNPAQKAAGRSDGLLQLVYVGLLNPSRGLDVTLRAVAYANQGGAKVHLTLIGTGKSAANLRDLVRHLDIEAAVTFKGWMDNKEIPKEIAAADCGIVPHRECSHWHHTIPNKLFDYMAASRPVIVSSARPAARIVREAECGLVYKNDDPADLARQILTLGSPELRHRLGKNGLNAVQTKYRWEKDAAVLLEGLTAAVSDHSGKGRR